MYNLKDIKLIIWDLDDTFWSGIISEGAITPLEQNVLLVKQLVAKGIMNSICSKNDAAVCGAKLKELGVHEYFVFPSINWSPKGQRLKEIIDRMQLRAVNVLFVDDSPANLKEAQFFADGLMIAEPGEIPALAQALGALPDDPACARLKQYKLLETKTTAREKSSSNTEFLYSCNITVAIKQDCQAQRERIAELINRTNQLNYTKKRLRAEELDSLLEAPGVESGYVEVADNFGAYGLVGFYALNKKNNELEHFLFSCRVLSMGIEQYVYAKLNGPRLTVVGEVVTPLSAADPCPPWINKSKARPAEAKTISSSILFKGPCDISQVVALIKAEQVEAELTYVGQDKGNLIEHHNHTFLIRESLTLSKAMQRQCIDELVFNDKDLFSTSIFSRKYDYVVLSLLVDYALGVYRHRSDNYYISFAQYNIPLTAPEFRDSYLSGAVATYGNKFSSEFLDDFNRKFEFVGRISKEALLENLKFIRSQLDESTTLILLNGAEAEDTHNQAAHLKNRHLSYREYNAFIKNSLAQLPNTVLIDVNKYIASAEDYVEGLSHYSRRVYYKIARELAGLVGQADVAVKSRVSLFVKRAAAKLRGLVRSP
jgi:FkbH-like protein